MTLPERSQKGEVLVFVRSPRIGAVKTRLMRKLSAADTLTLYRCFAADVLETVSRQGFPVRVCFHPPADAPLVRDWLGPRLALEPQRGRDLGERMAGALAGAFQRGRNRCLLLGTDVPDLPGTVLKDAMEALERSDAVLGPSSDGGYYLVGFRRSGWEPRAFAGIPWGTPAVLERTVALLRGRRRSVAFVRTWRDVDEPRDLELLIRAVASDPQTPAARTAAFLEAAGHLERR
jgi:rSAM/selenodomain-associated transferase 1